ncbi:MAG: 3-dehydroquinate synthase, partial [Planctomycetota bacterium]
MTVSSRPAQLDIAFDVPQKQRIRFTDDVTGSDLAVLLDVLRPGHGQVPAKVLTVVDADVHDQHASLQVMLQRMQRSSRITLVAPPMVVPGGEAIKNGEDSLRQILHAINDYNLDRRS